MFTHAVTRPSSTFIKIGFITVTFLLSTFLHSSATHNPHILKHYVLNLEIKNAYKALWPAAKYGDAVALSALVKLAAHQEDHYWLENAARLNYVPAILVLATTSTDENVSRRWLKNAAELNHAPSQFELSLAEPDLSVRLGYLHDAASSNHQPAVIAYAKYWYDLGVTDKAITWLTKAAVLDPKSAFKLARLLWQQGDKQRAIERFEQAALYTDEAKSYLSLIKAHEMPRATNISALQNPKALPLKAHCSQQLQFVATSLDSAVQATEFAQKFARDPRFSNMDICINNIKWLPQNILECSVQNHRQSCVLSRLANANFSPDYTHLVMFLPTGTAYVYKGVMYLDQADTYSVFVHELAHLVGFADEYAISSELAKQHCFINEPDTNKSAPNLAITQDLLNSKQYAVWQSFVDPATELEYMKARTCDKLAINAYKPSRDITFLQHHDTDNIPPLYLAMWQSLLSEQHHLKAVAEHFYYQALADNNTERASYWQSLYQ